MYPKLWNIERTVWQEQALIVFAVVELAPLRFFLWLHVILIVQSIALLLACETCTNYRIPSHLSPSLSLSLSLSYLYLSFTKLPQTLSLPSIILFSHLPSHRSSLSLSHTLSPFLFTHCISLHSLTLSLFLIPLIFYGKLD